MLMSKMNEREVLLEVKNLKQYFKINSNTVVKAIDDISFNIYKGETFGLVGESGSGKSTTGRSIIRLYQPTAGEVYFKGKNIATKLTKKEKAEVCQKNSDDFSGSNGLFESTHACHRYYCRGNRCA